MERSELGFSAAVLRDFEFFVRDHGFRCTQQSVSNVRCESGKVFLEVFHGIYDFEIGLHFGRLGSIEKFDFTLYLRRFFPDVERLLGNRFADVPGRVNAVTKTLADAVRENGQPILSGDPDTFEKMGTVRWWHFSPEALGRKGIR